MKHLTHLLVFLVTVFLFTACSASTPTSIPVAPSNRQLARQSLVDFLYTLHSRQYVEAARFYGGSYEMLIAQNPQIDPQDHAGLLQNACSNNGFMCLQTSSIEQHPSPSDTEFTFTVQFQNDDGSLFIQGPCCGESEIDSPPISEFLFRVSQDQDGSMLVLDMVPYIP